MTQEELEQLKTDFEQSKTQMNEKLDFLTNENLSLKKQLQEQKNLTTLKNPYYNIDFKTTFFNNPSNSTNLNIMVKQKMMEGDFSFFAYKLFIELCQIAKSLFKFDKCNYFFQKLIYETAKNGVVAVGKENGKAVIFVPNNIGQNWVEGKELNFENLTQFSPRSIRLKRPQVALLQLNDERWNFWILGWEILQELAELKQSLHSMSVFLNRQLAVKIDPKKFSSSMDFLTASLGNPTLPFIAFSKDMEISPIDFPKDAPQQILEYINNAYNFFVFHLFNLPVEDLENQKERDVASQQLNRGLIAKLKNDYMKTFIQIFVDEFNVLFESDVHIIDETEEALKQQIDQAQTMNKQRNGEENDDEEL